MACPLVKYMPAVHGEWHQQAINKSVLSKLHLSLEPCCCSCKASAQLHAVKRPCTALCLASSIK